MDKAQRAVRTHEDGTAEDWSLSTLPPLFNQAHRNLELLGRATGELCNDGAPVAQVTLIRALSVPRMPGIQTVQGIALVPAAQVVESRGENAIEAPAEEVEFDERGSGAASAGASADREGFCGLSNNG